MLTSLSPSFQVPNFGYLHHYFTNSSLLTVTIVKHISHCKGYLLEKTNIFLCASEWERPKSSGSCPPAAKAAQREEAGGFSLHTLAHSAYLHAGKPEGAESHFLQDLYGTLRLQLIIRADGCSFVGLKQRCCATDSTNDPEELVVRGENGAAPSIYTPVGEFPSHLDNQIKDQINS